MNKVRARTCRIERARADVSETVSLPGPAVSLRETVLVDDGARVANATAVADGARLLDNDRALRATSDLAD